MYFSAAQAAQAQMLTSIGRTVGAANETFDGIRKELVAAVDVLKQLASLRKDGGGTNADVGKNNFRSKLS